MTGFQAQRGSSGGRDADGLSGLDIERLKELVRQLERNRGGDARSEISRGPGDARDRGPRDFQGGPDGFPGGPRGPDFRRPPDRLADLEGKMDRILQELEDIRRELRRR